MHTGTALRCAQLLPVSVAVPDVAVPQLLFSCCRVKPAIFDLLLAVCIAAYLGVAYVAVQVGEKQETNFLFSS